MKLNTKKTKGVTEKPIIEELDQHYWAAYHNGRMDGKYQALAEYKQKLIQRCEKKRKNIPPDDGTVYKHNERYAYQLGFNDCLDEVEAVIKDL